MRVQCSPASVGLAQARPNKLQLDLSKDSRCSLTPIQAPQRLSKDVCEPLQRLPKASTCLATSVQALQ